MGSIDASDSLKAYSVPNEASKILQTGILFNPKIARDLPSGTSDFAPKINFAGNGLPSLPINWRFAESAAALKGLEACLITQLVRRKYGVEVASASINTDHASLFLMSSMVWSFAHQPSVSDAGHQIAGLVGSKEIFDLIPNYDFFGARKGMYRAHTLNIYPTKDGRWFNLHGSLNPDKSMKAIGLPPQPADPEMNTNIEKSRKLFMDHVGQLNSDELQHRVTNIHNQAGCITNSVEEFRQSEHGKANEHVGLFEIYNIDSGHKASWWPSNPQTSAERPLAGLKVVDLTRIIAAPAVTRGLAELGASVMRVTSPNQPDFSQLHIDMNWGKWNSSLDLKDEAQREKLKDLILDADVVVQGYRPGVLDKYGFGQDDIIDLVRTRDRGIISVRENCYGWHGPWKDRTGWQQISDACTGISHGFGKAMKLENDEPVTPIFPNSDFMTGVAGICGILVALMRKGEKGGSYKVDLALNYYNSWLAESCGQYPSEVWEDLWGKNGRPVFRAWDLIHTSTIPTMMQLIQKKSGDIVFNKDFFENRKSDAIGAEFNVVKPIINFDHREIKLGYNVGTRGNGKDAARWPEDLMTEVVV